MLTLPLLVAGFCLQAQAQTVVWDLGADLITEANSASPGSNPNSSVPAWSYGWNNSAIGGSINLFLPSEWIANMDGFLHADGFGHVSASGPYVTANGTGANIIYNWGPGPLNPLYPGEVRVDPSSSGLYIVFTWTAPAAGTYEVQAGWRDLDPYGGNGLDAYVLVNGSSITGGAIANGGTLSLAPTRFSLLAGDTVQFVTGPNGDPSYDTTGLKATISLISAVPEPSAGALLALGLLALGAWGVRRRASG